MSTSIEERLTGGHPNSLGNTVSVVEDVLAHHQLFDELFDCYFSSDEVVRLRVSNAMKRVSKENKSLLPPYFDRFLDEIANISQASAQWSLAQLFLSLDKDLSAEQKESATSIMKNNLSNHEDWIVLNQTMETLAQWSQKDDDLKAWLKPHLIRLGKETRKSISNKASKWLEKLQLL